MDLVTWNSLMSCRRWPMTLTLFGRMAQEGLEPDDISYTALAAPWAASLLALPEIGRRRLAEVEVLTDAVTALEEESGWRLALAVARHRTADRMLTAALLRCWARATQGQQALDMRRATENEGHPCGRRQLGEEDVICAVAQNSIFTNRFRSRSRFHGLRRLRTLRGHARASGETGEKSPAALGKGAVRLGASCWLEDE